MLVEIIDIEKAYKVIKDDWHGNYDHTFGVINLIDKMADCNTAKAEMAQEWIDTYRTICEIFNMRTNNILEWSIGVKSVEYKLRDMSLKYLKRK